MGVEDCLKGHGISLKGFLKGIYKGFYKGI